MLTDEEKKQLDILEKKKAEEDGKKVEFSAEDVKDISSAVKELRKEVEDANSNNVSKIEGLNTVLDAYEEKHQKLVAQKAEEQNRVKDLEDKLAVMDKNLSKPAIEGKSKFAYRDTPEYKAINKFCVEGEPSLLDLEVKNNLRTDIDSQGGYLVPEVLANLILKEIEELSPVRQFARKFTTKVKSLSIPVRNGIPSAPYEGETESGSKSKSNYRSETLTGFRQQARVGATMDLLMFSNFNMEGEILSDSNLAFAVTEGNKFLVGSGVKEPEGILTNADIVSKDTSQSSGAITGTVLFDDVINLVGDLKIGYNPIYFFNRSTLAFLRTAKSTAGGYLWQIGGTTMPMQIVGFDYSVFQDMPSIGDGVGSKFLGFGDLFAGYTILDSVQMSVVRDQFTELDQGIVVFNVTRWNTGQVTVPEAIKLLDVKA